MTQERVNDSRVFTNLEHRTREEYAETRHESKKSRNENVKKTERKEGVCVRHMPQSDMTVEQGCAVALQLGAAWCVLLSRVRVASSGLELSWL